MTGLGLVLIIGVVVALVFVAVRRHLNAATTEEGVTEKLFGIEQLGGDVTELAITDQSHIGAGWQQVRFPAESSRSGAPSLQGERQWLAEHCQGRWRVESTSLKETIFWFENAADAKGFAMTWFPIKSG